MSMKLMSAERNNLKNWDVWTRGTDTGLSAIRFSKIRFIIKFIGW
jgi:hypothetical protein